MRFVDRQRELKALDTFYHGRSAGLLILYGRRRVGKTSLLAHWIEQRSISNALFWTATTHGSAYQLRDFSQALMRFDPRFKAPPTEDFTFRGWEDALNYLGELAALSASPLLVIVDEFTHLVQAEPVLPSILQKVWDHRLSKIANLRQVLTGSLVGLMERDVLSSQAPLYGRPTALMRLRPLPFGTLAEILPDWPPAERVAVYAVCGGIPTYLSLFARSKNFVEGLRDQCLSPGSVMLTDPALLLHDQLHEPYIYESVLSSIASGFHIWNEIATMAGVSETSLGHYLRTLQALELVERRDPVLGESGSRKGRYYVADPFLRFYYRFVIPHITAIERGDLSRAVKTINQDLRAFIGTYVFEELCREWVAMGGPAEGLGFLPEAIGSFWVQSRKGGLSVQLDVVAASRREKCLFIGEAKWGVGQVSRQTLTDLVKRSQRMPQVTEQGWRVQYALFAREGFSEAARQAAKEMGASLVDLPQLERRLIEAATQVQEIASTGEIEF